MRFLKRLLVGVGSLALAACVALFAASWYFADVLHHDGLLVDRNRKPDVQVVALDGNQITLLPVANKSDGPRAQDGVWGLEWGGGYAQVGRIAQVQDRQVQRAFTPFKGQQPSPGDQARLDGWAFPGDPQAAFGLPFQEVTYTSPVGTFPAWLVRGTTSTWAIMVHGKNAERQEALRMLPTLTSLGLSSLVITYRNDADVPAPADGMFRFGATEWADLEGAAQYALDHGARNLVLVGYSMGGAIVPSFLYRSPLADRVIAVILDAPALDFASAVRYQAGERGIPGIITNVAEGIAGVRFGIDWGELNYLAHADRLRSPILLFHGEADLDVPLETSDALAAARPDLVQYVRTPGAGHVRSWNVNPDRYTAAVAQFLQPLLKS